ncbi:MAG: hypothetical protein MUO26_15155 [Methanotrichaceae archaeon]|nr:hypothetical protein [Methanotrichaceae archaeon]
MKEVPIDVRYDVGKSSENPMAHGVRVRVKILQDMELRRPLYYFTVPGIILAVVGIGMGLRFLQTFYHGDRLHFGLTLLMILITLIGSFMAPTGIILHSFSKMMLEFKKAVKS